MVPDAPTEDPHSSTLPKVAGKAGQPQIVVVVGASLGDRDDVVQSGRKTLTEPPKAIPTLLPVSGLEGADLALLPPRADCCGQRCPWGEAPTSRVLDCRMRSVQGKGQLTEKGGELPEAFHVHRNRNQAVHNDDEVL
jgi:hypothetical protein